MIATVEMLEIWVFHQPICEKRAKRLIATVEMLEIWVFHQPICEKRAKRLIATVEMLEIWVFHQPICEKRAKRLIATVEMLEIWVFHQLFEKRVYQWRFRGKGCAHTLVYQGLKIPRGYQIARRRKMNKNYEHIVKTITSPSKTIFLQAQTYLDNLAKPPGSLGKLEEIAARLCAISGNLAPSITKRCIIVSSADNGVIAEGVASAPEEVTAIQTLNMLDGVAGISVLAKQFNADLFIADVGINGDVTHPQLINKKIRKSTGNIAKEMAFSRKEAELALETGIALVCDAKESGYQMIGVGEMGIGNTTTSSAVLAALLGLEGEDIGKVVGKGAGLEEAAYLKKVKVVQTALQLHQPGKYDPIDILHKVGGLDLATMTGVYLGAAYYRLPVVIDGFISVVAALCAAKLNPRVVDYMFASHHSFERGYGFAVEELGLKPGLHLEMRLGEGSGCPLMFSIMDASLAILKNMATFAAGNISTDYVENIDNIKEAAVLE